MCSRSFTFCQQTSLCHNRGTTRWRWPIRRDFCGRWSSWPTVWSARWPSSRCPASTCHRRWLWPTPSLWRARRPSCRAGQAPCWGAECAVSRDDTFVYWNRCWSQLPSTKCMDDSDLTMVTTPFKCSPVSGGHLFLSGAPRVWELLVGLLPGPGRSARMQVLPWGNVHSLPALPQCHWVQR